ncbi:glycosyltransferase [Prevotella sp. A2931]|uniref:Glycosyltransferase n=1 Tax=Prevotella illustrans TaxID=2800387 RepID=A0ABS3M7I0_9BACT|nr:MULTISPECIES: glycosyltransferase family 2 protein [Prevotella]MBO1364094.1 glycosyltransferase [Prevotella illustrans]PTL27047.1 glycosyltransferase [Prevotella sp. oral taxon 820]
MITFSIITCTYQAASLLQRTLDSVRQQAWGDVEHILLDGASTDGTVDMIRIYQRENEAAADSSHRIVFKSEPDHGLYDAMNKGIREATGDYLVFLNAGDALPSPDTLEIIANSVGEGEALPGVLYGDTNIVDVQGRFLRHRRLAPPKRLTWRSFLQGMVVCHQAFYARVDLAKRNPYDLRYKLSADVDWCIRIMKDAAYHQLPLRDVNAVVVNYLAGGMSVKNHRASLIERFQVMRRHYGLLPTVAVHLWFVVRGIFKK